MEVSRSVENFPVERLADFREYLRNELQRRQKTNPSYSLRAFARQLKMQSSFLSKILRGERKITPAFVARVSERLGLSEENLAEFQASATLMSRCHPNKTFTQFKFLPEDVFTAISHWYHYAIVELTKTEGFRYDIDWMAAQLKLTAEQVSDAIARLVRLGLLEVTAGQTLRSTGSFSNAIDKNLVTKAQRNLQAEILSKGIQALENTPVTERDQSSITVACASSLLPEVKERIKVFRRELGGFLSHNVRTADKVYHLSVSFYPVSGGKQ